MSGICSAAFNQFPCCSALYCSVLLCIVLSKVWAHLSLAFTHYSQFSFSNTYFSQDKMGQFLFRIHQSSILLNLTIDLQGTSFEPEVFISPLRILHSTVFHQRFAAYLFSLHISIFIFTFLMLYCISHLRLEGP